MDVNISAGIPQQISSIDTLILDLPPSCIEFWRADIQPEYFVIGTYNLEKQEQGTSTEDSSTQVQAPNPQERNGSLILCELGGDKIHILHTLAVPFAILDLHFANRIQRDGKPCHSNWFYTANSTGSIASFRISSLFDGLSTPAKLVIEQQEIHQLWPKDILVLSLCWHPHHADKLSVTLSNGEVHVLSCRDATLKPVGWWQSTTKLALHSLEAWTSAFLGIEGATERGEEMIFSGGDDGILQYTKCPLRYKFLDEEGKSKFSCSGTLCTALIAMFPNEVLHKKHIPSYCAALAVDRTKSILL
jgi:diphthamide biosynthesis protein 7